MKDVRLIYPRLYRDRRAFTLIEIVASMAVLSLIVVSMSQLLDNASDTTIGIDKHIDSDSEARLVLDRMADDFTGMAKRPDINYCFHHQTANGTQGGSGTPAGNDALYFFSAATGYYASTDANGTTAATQNPFTLAGYRINDYIAGQSTGRFQLERLGRGLHWYDSTMTSPDGPTTAAVYLPLAIFTTSSNTGSYDKVLSDAYNNSSNLNPDPTSVPQWDVIGDEVVRLEFCYLLKDGTLSDIPVTYIANGLKNNVGVAVSGAPTASSDVNSGYASGSRWYDRTAEIGYVCVSATAAAAIWMPVGLQDTRAVVVSIALLDPRSRSLTGATALGNLVGALADFSVSSTDPNTSQPYLMATAWRKTLTQKNFASTIGMPATAVANVRVYQRYFYLN